MDSDSGTRICLENTPSTLIENEEPVRVQSIACHWPSATEASAVTMKIRLEPLPTSTQLG